jgi:hypothetical protein
MTILLLCREQDLAKEPAGYVRAFRRRGIRVVFLEKDTPANADLRQLVALCPEPPQLILHPEQGFLPKGLHASPVPTAILQADPYAYTHRRVRWAMLFDYVLLLHTGFEERFRQAGHPRPLTLPHAVDAESFAGPEQERAFQVSSVGRVDGKNYRMRREVLAALAQEFRMNDWARAHSYEELAAVYRKTKVIVNIGRDDYPVDVSLRFAEAMAAGALFLTPQPSELDSLGFVEGNHFVGFHHRKEIAPLVRRYLNDEPARRRIAEAAREKVLQEHTYDVRVETLLRNLEIDAGKNFAPARRWPEARAHLTYLDYFAAHRNLDCAASELHAIAGQSLRDTVHGLALLARAWVRMNLSSVAQQFHRARSAISGKA